LAEDTCSSRPDAAVDQVGGGRGRRHVIERDAVADVVDYSEAAAAQVDRLQPAGDDSLYLRDFAFPDPRLTVDLLRADLHGST